MSSPHEPSLPQLRAALLDFQQHPGKYSIARREPALLFASTRILLQIAAGRSGGEHDEALRGPACSFVRLALIYPGANHYALLGLGTSADAATIKEHYRLMMRLMHPDFAAASGPAWPTDAATRLNLAYETLASPERRARYDEGLSPPARMSRPSRPLRALRAGPAPRKAPPADARSVLKMLTAGFGVAGALGVAAFLLAGGGERDGLVQKPFPSFVAPPAPAPPPTVAPRPMPIPMPISMPIPASTVTAPSLPAPPPSTLEPIEQPAPAITTVPIPTPEPAKPKPNPGVTLDEAQPLLATLLQHIESGHGDRLLSMLDREARSTPSAQALSRQIDGIADGVRPVRISNVRFRSEPAEGRLLVIGHMQVHAGDAADASAPGRNLALRAEFVSRGGAVSITSLSALAGN